uniref:Uncharacterized protein n=1 Tax=Anguilla anguilla TaxID=7936 RepID=A0A0E9WTJ4_ANGAN
MQLKKSNQYKNDIVHCFAFISLMRHSSTQRKIHNIIRLLSCDAILGLCFKYSLV